MMNTVVTFLIFTTALAASGQTTSAPLAKPTPIAATAPTVVPALVPYAALAEKGDGSTLTGDKTLTFQLYKDESGGEPLWTESQNVSIDTFGLYTVELGAGSPNGLPMDLFASGEGRWLGVQIAGEKPQPRVLLTSVPYALKAADAATLGGLPASAFALVGSNTNGNVVSSPAAAPDASSSDDDGGTNDYLPKFTGSTTVANSQVYDNGTNVGIGVIPNSSVKLDVGGAMIVRGNTIVSRSGNATSSIGYPSYGFDFYSNAYNSSTKTTTNPYFSLRSEPAATTPLLLRQPSTCDIPGPEPKPRPAFTSIRTAQFTSLQTRHFPGAPAFQVLP